MNARKEISGGLVLALLGVGYLVYSTRYPMDTLANPGPAVFPLMIGSIFALLAIGRVFQGVRRFKGDEGRAEPRSGSGRSKPFILIVLFVLYLLLMKAVGFYVSNLLFVLGSSRLIGARDWLGPLLLAVGINLFCYLLFEVWLKVSLPKGVLYSVLA
jgi:putative tricarboxylic transport membrane protein